MDKYNKIITDMFSVIKVHINNGTYSKTEHLDLLVQIVEYVENVEGASGAEKKEIAIKLLQNVYENIIKADNNINQNLAQIFFKKEALSHTIDLIVAITKGKYHINRKAKTFLQKITTCDFKN